MKEKEEEEGAFLPVSANESSNSRPYVVQADDAKISSSLWWSPFPLSSAVRGLVKQRLP